jgi:hypothetical protein
MADIVNLRQARKAKARATSRDAGDAARAKHGASRAQTSLTEAEAARAAKTLEGHRRPKTEPEPDAQ